MSFGPLNQYEFIYLFRAVFLLGRFCPLNDSCLINPFIRRNPVCAGRTSEIRKGPNRYYSAPGLSVDLLVAT
jgi:hypothetical protein